MIEKLKNFWYHKPYHVHGLEGFQKCTYVYVGNYRTEYFAKWASHRFVAKFPYGTASVTTNPNPVFTD